MSNLISIIDSLKLKLTHSEYKSIIDEINRQNTIPFCKVKIAIPWIETSTDDCGEQSLSITHKFIILIMPLKYIEDSNIYICNSYPLSDIFENSLHNDSESFLETLQKFKINSLEITNKTCIIISIEKISLYNSSDMTF